MSDRQQPSRTEAAADRRGKRARRRQRAAETRIHSTFGQHQRKRLHDLAVEAGISDSQLVRNLVDEALIARSRNQRPPSLWSKSPSEGTPRESASPNEPGTRVMHASSSGPTAYVSELARITWTVPPLADIFRAQAAITSLVASGGVDTSVTHTRRRRRQRCCTCCR